MAGVMTDPRVRFAIARACEKRARRDRRRQVEEALRSVGGASLRDLVDLTGLEARECGEALDALRIDGRVQVDDDRVFRWV